jgi:hypothetical protein
MKRHNVLFIQRRRAMTQGRVFGIFLLSLGLTTIVGCSRHDNLTRSPSPDRTVQQTRSTQDVMTTDTRPAQRTTVTKREEIVTTEAPNANVRRTMASAESGGHCSLVMRNPALRTDNIFGPIQVRIFEDPKSDLYPHEGGMQITESRTGRTLAQAEGGTVGGTAQSSTSAQAAGSSAEIQPGHPSSSGGVALNEMAEEERLRYNERLTPAEREQLYGDGARIADRRGALLWAGWVKPDQKIDIGNYRGPIRYDYRFVVDDRFHDPKTVWCSSNRVITIP